MRIGKRLSIILAAAMLVATLSGCERKELKDAAYAGGKLIYDTLKAVNTPLDD